MALRLHKATGEWLAAPTGLSTSSYALAAWLYFTTLPLGGASDTYHDIWSRANAGGTIGTGISLFLTGGSAKWNIGDGATDTPGSTAVVANRWYHVAHSRTSAG